MLLFQGDIMLEGSLVSWKRGARSHKGLNRTARNSVWGSSTLQASAVSSLFKGPKAKKDLRRSQSFGGGRTRSSWTQTITAQPRARSKDERLEPEPAPAEKPKEEEVPEDVAPPPTEPEREPVQEAGSMPELTPEVIPGVVSESGEEAVQLSGFVGDSSCLNGTFTADGTEVNGKQVYSQGDGSKECMWYHNGAWRIGSYNWLATKDLGRCHAFVKTEHDLDHIAASETWMSCLGPAGGDPDGQDGSLFQPQMSARAAKLALDNVVKRTGSKKAPVPSLSSNRLTNILTDQSLRHAIEPPPMTPPKRNTWGRGGSKDEANLSMSNQSDAKNDSAV